MEKILLNSVVSTKVAKFLYIDLKYFYLGTPMAQPEYMLTPLPMTPLKIIREYNIIPLVYHGKVLAQINRGMYGLPQAGYIVYNKLIIHLTKGGYAPTGNAWRIRMAKTFWVLIWTGITTNIL